MPSEGMFFVWFATLGNVSYYASAKVLFFRISVCVLSNRDCEIVAVGKSRNGKPRFWCMLHGANATGRYGARLEECESAYLVVDEDECFDINATEYPGGVGIWGAVAPIYNSSILSAPSGVHVHARDKSDSEEKVIDNTFPAVKISYKPTCKMVRSHEVARASNVVASRPSRFARASCATFSGSFRLPWWPQGPAGAIAPDHASSSPLPPPTARAAT